LAEYALLAALILAGLVGILFGMQSHLAKIYTKANNEMGIADCAGSCSVGSSGGSSAGQPAGSSGSAAGSSGGSGTGSGGIVLGDQTPAGGPAASAGPGAGGSGGGSGGSQAQPGIHVPIQ
jgi:Flp pilus assembly pilin Flp